MMTLRITVDNPDNTGKRIDLWLSEAVNNLSRSRLKSLIQTGGVLVSGRAVKPSYIVKTGDVAEITLPEPSKTDVYPENIPLDVIYEDSQLIVVNKPKGMVVHPAPGHYSGTLVNALLFHCAGRLSGINGVLRPGIVHRLDKDTSGLLVAAKTDAAHQSFAAQLAARTMTRRYKAIACGRIDSPICIEQSIARHKTDRKKMTVDPAGRHAVTHITPIGLTENRGVCTYIEARLETGRTHQIRVHMTYIHRPLLGDILYGGRTLEPSSFPTGQVLHAGVLGFFHPKTNQYLEFTTDIPAYFRDLLNSSKNLY